MLLSVLSLTDNDVFGFEKKDLKSLTLIHFNGSVPDITPDAVYPLSFNVCIVHILSISQ